MSKIILGDCLEIMRGFDDNQFDLLLTDPPYGINQNSYRKNRAANGLAQRKDYGRYNDEWDNKIPSREYFDEMRRISKNQIIFGGNFFVEYLTNSSCWLVWDKDGGNSPFADCELAWTSFKTATRCFKHRWSGMLQHDMKNKEDRYHPTQKPVRLMRWCLSNYSKEGDTILDPFTGSGTTLRAAKDLNRDCTGIDISPEYCKIAENRLKQEILL